MALTYTPPPSPCKLTRLRSTWLEDSTVYSAVKNVGHLTESFHGLVPAPDSMHGLEKCTVSFRTRRQIKGNLTCVYTLRM